MRGAKARFNKNNIFVQPRNPAVSDGGPRVKHPFPTICKSEPHMASMLRERDLPSGIWDLQSGIWSLESGAWNLESGAWNLEPVAWSPEPGAWSLESEIWNLDSGAWHDIITTVY